MKVIVKATIKITTIMIAMLLLSNLALAEMPLPKGVIKQDGRDAPALKLLDLDGKSFDLKKSRGRWVFVHFWATWCGPCRREMPLINEVWSTFENSDLEFVLVNTAETEDIVFEFIGIAAPDMMSLMDTDGLVTEKWQPRGLPSTYFVDPQGRVKYLALGGRPWNKPEYIKFLQALSQTKSQPLQK